MIDDVDGAHALSCVEVRRMAGVGMRADVAAVKGE